MSMNLSAKLDELQRGDRHMETTVALCEIRTQLQELTKSVESCQSEVSEVSGMGQLYHCLVCPQMNYYQLNDNLLNKINIYLLFFNHIFIICR